MESRSSGKFGKFLAVGMVVALIWGVILLIVGIYIKFMFGSLLMSMMGDLDAVVKTKSAQNAQGEAIVPSSPSISDDLYFGNWTTVLSSIELVVGVLTILFSCLGIYGRLKHSKFVLYITNVFLLIATLFLLGLISLTGDGKNAFECCGIRNFQEFSNLTFNEINPDMTKTIMFRGCYEGVFNNFATSATVVLILILIWDPETALFIGLTFLLRAFEHGLRLACLWSPIWGVILLIVGIYIKFMFGSLLMSMMGDLDAVVKTKSAQNAQGEAIVPSSPSISDDLYLGNWTTVLSSIVIVVGVLTILFSCLEIYCGLKHSKFVLYIVDSIKQWKKCIWESLSCCFLDVNSNQNETQEMANNFNFWAEGNKNNNMPNPVVIIRQKRQNVRSIPKPNPLVRFFNYLKSLTFGGWIGLALASVIIMKILVVAYYKVPKLLKYMIGLVNDAAPESANKTISDAFWSDYFP